MSSYNTGIGTIHTLLTIFSSNHFWVRIHLRTISRTDGLGTNLNAIQGCDHYSTPQNFYQLKGWNRSGKSLGIIWGLHGIIFDHLTAVTGFSFGRSLQHLDRQEVGHAHLPEDKKMSLTGACYLRELSGKCWQNWSLHALSIVSLSSFKLVFLPCQKHSRTGLSSFTQSNSFRSRIHG